MLSTAATINQVSFDLSNSSHQSSPSYMVYGRYTTVVSVVPNGSGGSQEGLHPFLKFDDVFYNNISLNSSNVYDNVF